MLAGNQQQERVNAAMTTVRNAYNNIGKVKKFINVVLLIISIIPFFLTLLVNYVLKPKENETKLLIWLKNIIRAVLITVLAISTLAPLILFMLPVLCIFLLNREFVREVMQVFYLIREVPEAERQNLIQELMNNIPVLIQTTHDPSAISSVNLSVDRLIEKYKDNFSKEEFYAELNGKNTAEIEEYIKQSNEFTEEKKSHALKCLEFINETTGDSFRDNYSNFSLKQITVLCWKACSDIETGMEGEHVPLSDKDIQNRKDIFIKGLIDAATTYGNKGQSCAGGTYNKIIESLSGLHPLIVITLDEKEVSQMIKKTIIDKFSVTAREILGSFSETEQEVVKGELSDITVSYIVKVYNSTLEQCKKFSSRLKDSEKEEVLKECMDNLPYVSFDNHRERGLV